MKSQDYKAVETGLKSYPKAHVSVYMAYLKQLETDKDSQGKIKAWWFGSKFTPAQAIDLFKKVAIDEMYIDGDHITLGYKGKPLVQYDYQAYKNKMLMVYPESQIDVQLVKKGDNFKFSKRDGVVRYTHDIADPFGSFTVDNLAGAYCIIKNGRGEFLELLGPDDVAKMRKVAKTDTIWKQWYDRMVRKSVIKRACKSHFDDITGHMDKLDNENYDLSKIDDLGAPDAILAHIETFTDVEELLSWAAGDENKIYHNDDNFRSAVKAKKVALEQDKDPAEEPQKELPLENQNK